MSKIYINGKFFSDSSAAVSVFDRSYLYGEGTFETMRAYNGRPAFCDLHYHRLKTNCDKLKIDIPVDEYAFEHAIVRTLNINRLKDAYIRVTLSLVGMSLGLARPSRLRSNFVIVARPFHGRPAELYERGAKLIVVESIFADDPEIAEIKSTSYLTKMIARLEVTGKKADEGILRNRQDMALEGTASNLFVVKKGRLFTPPVTDGCLPGVTRWAVMGLAESMGIPCKETSIPLAGLKSVDEIFMTGSTSEVLPVREISGLVRRQAPGPVTSKLMYAYKQLLLSKK